VEIYPIVKEARRLLSEALAHLAKAGN
jgi:hypothetical protein